ncbi:ABC transporter ATP-binding protein [Iodidimonas gelatinilytica]|uniref:ABC transporter ATP-binding protein n=1 Tax=Iodidimonas gelatinilytica TaxID=1236966 RepID=A0A5A7N1S1_9PROT|nr:ABC transporter ATP-binding protein [Iodidimonas gelatinilytica]GER02221.1 ABC transporter ATP-binding protein [Iodidimonas gelatinilytica]
MNDHKMHAGNPVIEATGLAKQYGKFTALKGVDFTIPLGRIYGVIGANGAGKTTLLNAILGLIPFDGDVRVLGKDPGRQRDELMKEVCFIADVATLPRWMKVSQLLDYVEGVHPRFSRTATLNFLERTKIPQNKAIKALSKGMVTQLHLAIVMGIDARLLVLDEPTLGLDILFRKAFYRDLLEEYFDEERTIIVTTHQVEEIEHILSDVMFIRDGEIVLDAPADDLNERFFELVTDNDHADAARALNPIQESRSLGRCSFVYEDADRAALKQLGDIRRMSLADIFVAKMSGDGA